MSAPSMTEEEVDLYGEISSSGVYGQQPQYGEEVDLYNDMGGGVDEYYNYSGVDTHQSDPYSSTTTSWENTARNDQLQEQKNAHIIHEQQQQQQHIQMANFKPGELPEVPAIFLSNLTWWTTDQQLEDLIAPFAKIKTLKFFEDKINGKSKGTAFVEVPTVEAAKIVRDNLMNREVNGKELGISYVDNETFKQMANAMLKATGGSFMPKLPTDRPKKESSYEKFEKYEKDDKPPNRERGGMSYGRGRATSPTPPSLQQQGHIGIPLTGHFPPMMSMSAPYMMGRGRGPPSWGAGFPLAPGRGQFPMPTPHVNPAFFMQPPPPMQGSNRKRDRDDRENRDRDRDRERDREREKERDRDRDRDDRHRKRH